MKISNHAAANGARAGRGAQTFGMGLALLAGAVLTAACGSPSSAPSTNAPASTPAASAATPASTPAAAMAAATPAMAAAATPAAAMAATPAPASASPTPAAPAGTPVAAAPGVAPDEFKVKFELSNGTVVAAFHKAWAPIGVQRIYDLVNDKFFDEAEFFRVAPGFVVQFGIPADPKMDAKWGEKNLQDEPVKKPNARGTITFAKSGMPNSRSTQLFINLRDNTASLDPQGFSTLGEIVEGMDVVDKISDAYAEGRGPSPDQGAIHAQGNAYLKQNFPKLDYIKSATIVK